MCIYVSIYFLVLLQAVEKVLAGAIRREMALEEYCNKQAFDINQLNRLVCSFVIVSILSPGPAGHIF